MPVTLEVIAGPLKGKAFSFDRHETFLVGRAADAQISLPDDEYLSRAHFLVELNPPLARLIDLGSRNGTKVNGRSQAETPLNDGDIVEVGTSQIRVRLAPAAPPAGALTSELEDAPPETASQPRAAPRKTDSGKLDGQMIGGYRVERWLAAGSMGDVYRAARVADGKMFALKTIKPAITPKSDLITRFLREADILRQLRHDNIVAFEAMGESHGKLYFVMEHVAGTDAASKTRAARDAGQFPTIPETLRIAAGMLAGLAHAHRAGFVHRDIKPSNLLVADDGAVKLADFGLGRVYHESPLSGLTLSGQSVGTPAFMPPEQIRDFRTVKPAGDQYSAAATIYYLLTGEYPYGAKAPPADLYRRILTEPPAPVTQYRAGIPANVVKAISRAMSRAPADRFAGIADFAKALGAP